MQLVSWREATPLAFTSAPEGAYPQGRRLFLVLCSMPQHFLNPYIRWCRGFARQIAVITGITRKRFYVRPFIAQPVRSSVVQGTVYLFSHTWAKVETARVKTVRETRLTTATRSGVECSGFSSVIKQPGEYCYHRSRISFHHLHWPGLVSIAREHKTGQDCQYPKARGAIFTFLPSTCSGSRVDRALAVSNAAL